MFTVLNYSLFSLLYFFFLLFSFASFHCDIFKFKDSSAISSVIKRQLFYYSFLKSIAFLYDSFLEFPPFCLHYFSYMFSTFPIKALSILIIDLKNSQCDDSNISALFNSGYDKCSVSSDCAFLPFSRPCNFCWNVDRMYWVERCVVVM